MKILHTSDWHIGHTLYTKKRLHEHARFLDWLKDTIEERKIDALIVAGDVGETETHLRYAFTLLKERFARLFWVPGNHELWTLAGDRAAARGEAAWDRIEREALEFHRRVRAAYLGAAEREPERFVLIDARRPPSEIESIIVSKADELLSERSGGR